MYKANENRYSDIKYRRCGNSGLMLPEISLGLWHNFGGVDVYQNSRNMVLYSFDNGITHFDLANNYGPPAGSAEETFGKILKEDLKRYRDEIVISTKAGYYMWPGPYGDWGSRKYLTASIDQSLKRMGLDYVDIFYSHRMDKDTSLEETLYTLDSIVKQGKALYAGISSYSADYTQKAIQIFNELRTPFIIHQARYSMFDRWVEDGLLDVLEENKKGCIVFSPLAQGLLTDKYIKGIPSGSRADKSHGFLKKDQITEEKIDKILKLRDIAENRGQTIAQLACSWLLNNPTITSVLIGASSTDQIKQNLESIKNTSFSAEELNKIEDILK